MRKSIIWSSIFLVAFFISTCFNTTPASAQAADPPEGIHLTWRSNDTAHTITITWKTVMENAGDVVRYGTEPGGYVSTVVGSRHTYSGAGGYIHDVELTGLSPDTTYYFVCGGENGGWSDERSFRTAPDQRTSFRFVAGGDSRPGASDYPSGRDSISRTMAQFNPSFVLFTGDFAYSWNDQAGWDNWFAAVQEYWVDNDGLTIPIIPCIGNHEVYYPQPSDYDPETQATNYYGQFSLPSNERWYSLDWGPDLHIIVLDSEIRSVSDAFNEQLSWLENDLAAHASCLWKIAIFHRPAFTAGHYESDSLVQGYFVPLFDEYHVDLAFSAHDHGYQRTYPINYNVSKNTPMSSPKDGTVYIVSAGWGAPLYPKENRWWSAYFQSTYNFCVLDILENGTLRLQAVGTDGETFDEYYIYKSDVAVSISPEEYNGLPGENITFTVTVTNTGKLADNYDLTITDDAGWGATLGKSMFENVAPGESRETTISVTVPSGAAGGASTTITVTVTSQTNPIIESMATSKAAVATGVPPWVYVGVVIVIVVIISAVLIIRPF
jgi:hypothetical protein